MLIVDSSRLCSHVAWILLPNRRNGRLAGHRIHMKRRRVAVYWGREFLLPSHRHQIRGSPRAHQVMVATSSHSASSSDPSGPILLTKTDVVDVKTRHAVPENSSVRLYPTQMRFVTGIARAYDDDFPPELERLVKKEDFETAINQINNTMKDYWPCFFCMCCGYVCCPCTLGLSLLCPNLCIKDAEQYVRALVSRINKRPCFAKVGVQWRVVRSCGRSWIEISYPDTTKPIMAEVSYQAPTLTFGPGQGLTSSTLSAHTNSNGGSSSSSRRRNDASPLIVEV